MRLLTAAIAASALLVSVAPAARAQVETLMYDHVHMAVPDPQAAALWYHEHIGGEFVDGRDDRLLFGTTRIMFLRGEGRKRSEGSVVDHLGFSVPDLAAKLVELEGAGAKITTPLRDVSGLFKLSFLDDPWGTRLEVIEDEQHLGFHHIHLRAPDPEQALGWYHDHFGGVRTPMRGRLDGILYPGNVWLLVQRGEAAPSRESTIDHIGWRAIDLEPKVEELRRRGVTIETEPRPLTLPNGIIHFAYVAGPDGARVELVQRAPDMR
jgi:catechol 2,3-dioxygenase-like lactoylglutathione lyase family enzyme